MGHDEPIYNIGAVARMTAIPAATLRVWERRYGFPDTSRTEGGHRLYSDGDVRRLLWVKARIDEGMQVRQAVRALWAFEEEKTLPEPSAGEGATASASSVRGREEDEGVDPYLKLLQGRLFDMLVRHDTARADVIFGEALALYSPESVMLQMIRPTLWAIGEGWERGKVAVGTEHLATGYLRQRLSVWLTAGPPLFSVPPTVLACAPGEYHEAGLLILGALLRRRRWPVTYLGQSIPLVDLAAFAAQVKPLAIVTVAMTDETAAALVAWPEFLPEAAQTGRPVFAYGGLAFNEEPEWCVKVPGVFLGATLGEGVETLENTLRHISSPFSIVTQEDL